jgi:sterol desaturase/sphingolipid hydroxylase (fatty acid hydroxylase superfamily)
METPSTPLWEQATDAFAAVQDGVFTHAVQPLVHTLELGQYLEDAYAATQWLVIGLAQVLFILCLLVPLERWFPFERPGLAARNERRQAIAVDVAYTLIDRLGVLRLAMFLLLEPLWNPFIGWLTVQGVTAWHMDQWVATWWPGVTDTALAGFLAYAVVLDFAGYLVHRAQHRWDWWWALHAVHHSQRHMTAWSDSRNHLLDMLLVDAVFVLLDRVIGVAPEQFVGLLALSKMLESLSHANLNLSFGVLGERLLVSPRFHRIHHGVEVGSTPDPRQRWAGRNYGVLLPVWDIFWGTARFGTRPGPTGIADQHGGPGGRDYGRGFWAQQVLGLQRLAAALPGSKQTQIQH